MVRSLVLFVYMSSGAFIDFLFFSRDSEDSAPAEYPPDQPEADGLDDDSNAYGAEERELEAALLKELEESNKPAEGDDQEMEGADAPAGKDDEEEEISDAESEDLEAESDDDEDDLDEEEGGEGDDDVEMGDDAEQKDDAAKPTHEAHPEVMVH
jgi:histone chaperone ASF1